MISGILKNLLFSENIGCSMIDHILIVKVDLNMRVSWGRMREADPKPDLNFRQKKRRKEVMIDEPPIVLFFPLC